MADESSVNRSVYHRSWREY